MGALEEQAKKEDTLVPIRIELEHEGYKLRDTFTWNLHGKRSMRLYFLYIQILIIAVRILDNT
jgi:hypothetical protein